MSYKVFFVEDEIVAREGIRDNVDWKAHGFEFCGEAPDGEMALPLLQSLRPDILITDIRMPFMDGLELSRIVRERLPKTKVIILSGHDEFEYAQQAIKLGVSEYMLKPVSVQDLHLVLQKVAAELDRERIEQVALQRLREQAEESRAALKERFLLRLLTGVASSAEAIEKSGMLGIDLIARCYLVVLIRIEPAQSAETFDFQRCQRVQQMLAGMVEDNPDVFLLTKDMDELVLLIKGNSAENLYEDRELLIARAGPEARRYGCELIVRSGAPQQRITDIQRSFGEATDGIRSASGWHGGAFRFDKSELLKVGKSEIEDYLRSGTVEGLDALFETVVHPLGKSALGSPVVRAVIFTDIVMAAAKFVDELGGDVGAMFPELDNLETALTSIGATEQLRTGARDILSRALGFRDRQVSSQYAGVIRQAQDFISRRYMDPELSLNNVAAQVNLSPSHFSAIFSQETGRTFKEYLTETRIKRAKEMLRMTTLKVFEIGYQVGYSDPHYFSHVFHKYTGLTPVEFRLQAQMG